jgi:hypothetical protein
VARAICTSSFDAARVPIVIRRSPSPRTPHAVGRGVALLHLDRRAGLEVVALEKPQERAVLIDHARHRDRRADRARHQALRLLRLHLAVGGGNRVAVGIDLGPPEHLVHPVDQAFGDDVFELFGLVVHLVPRVAHDANEEQLHETVAAQHQRGELAPAGVSATPEYGSYSTSPDSAAP